MSSDNFYFIKPAGGLRVHDPLTMKHLPSYGGRVSPSSYWRRRLNDGDVEETTEAAIKAGRDKAEKAAASEKAAERAKAAEAEKAAAEQSGEQPGAQKEAPAQTTSNKKGSN